MTNQRIAAAASAYLSNRTDEGLANLRTALNWELTPSDYSEIAVRTEGSVSQIPQRLQREKTARLLHAAMGMCTGVAELYQNVSKASIDVVNFRDELGDAIWYPTVMAQILDIPLDRLLLHPEDVKLADPRLYLSESVVVDLSARLNEASIAVGEIQDAVRRHVFYGKLLDFARVTDNLARYLRCIQELGAELGVGFQEMSVTNLCKLFQLFGEKILAADLAAQPAPCPGPA